MAEEVKAKRDAEQNVSKKETSGKWLKKAATNTTTSHIKVCPYCGEVVKSNRCEICGKEINK